MTPDYLTIVITWKKVAILVGTLAISFYLLWDSFMCFYDDERKKDRIRCLYYHIPLGVMGIVFTIWALLED